MKLRYNEAMNKTESKASGEGETAYPKRVSLYETEEGFALLKELARRRGVSATGYCCGC